MGILVIFTPVCPSNPRFKKAVNSKQSAKPTHLITTASDSGRAASLYTISEHTSCSPYQVQLKLNSKPIVMEIDTGASVSLISESMLKALLPQLSIKRSTLNLITYTGESIPVKGYVKMSPMAPRPTLTLS